MIEVLLFLFFFQQELYCLSFSYYTLTGLCQCFHPWIGDDCSVNSTVPPELDQVGDGEPCDAVCSECLSVRLYGENLADVENLTCHYRILNV